jgi:hypothetical protein
MLKTWKVLLQLWNRLVYKKSKSTNVGEKNILSQTFLRYIFFICLSGSPTIQFWTIHDENKNTFVWMYKEALPKGSLSTVDLFKITCFVKIFNIKMSWCKLVCTRRSTVLRSHPHLVRVPWDVPIIWLFNHGTLTKGGWLRTFDLLVLTSLDQLIFTLKTLFTFFTKTSTLIRRSTVLTPSLQ